jgi:hypothetical protein
LSRANSPKTGSSCRTCRPSTLSNLPTSCPHPARILSEACPHPVRILSASCPSGQATGDRRQAGDSLAQLEQIQREQALQELEGLPQWAGLLERAQGTLGLDLPDANLRIAIQEPEVRFERNGQIVVQAYAEVLSLHQLLRLVMAPHASQGELVLDFV